MGKGNTMHVVVKAAIYPEGRIAPMTKAEVTNQWESGLDFQMLGLRNGYINIEDVRAERGGALDGVQVRYGKNLEKVTAFYFLRKV